MTAILSLWATRTEFDEAMVDERLDHLKAKADGTGTCATLDAAIPPAN
ncbi:MAG: hypothetical protein QNL18_08130 [Pseudomonadales bacterium]